MWFLSISWYVLNFSDFSYDQFVLNDKCDAEEGIIKQNANKQDLKEQKWS